MGIGGSAAMGFLESCSTAKYYAEFGRSGKSINLKKSVFTTVKEGKTIEKGYVLISLPNYNFPICVYKLSEDKYTAILMECSHNGCELQANKASLICPCHGSEFNKEGIVQSPPAEQNLKTFPTHSDTEHVYIQA